MIVNTALWHAVGLERAARAGHPELLARFRDSVDPWATAIPERVGPLQIEGKNAAAFPEVIMTVYEDALLMRADQLPLKSFFRLVRDLRAWLDEELGEVPAAGGLPSVLCVMHRAEESQLPPIPKARAARVDRRLPTEYDGVLGQGPVYDELYAAATAVAGQQHWLDRGHWLYCVGQESCPPTLEPKERHLVHAGSEVWLLA